jgi:hypothetical protein
MARAWVGLLAVIAAGCTTVNPSPNFSPASPTLAGSASTVPNETPSNEGLLVLLRSLGVDAAEIRSPIVRIDQGTTIWSADFAGANGGRIGTVEMNADTGKLWSLVIYGSAQLPSPPGPTLAPDLVAPTARSLLLRAGVGAAAETPQVAWDESDQEWHVSWTLAVGGYPVTADNVHVWIDPNGGLRSLADIEYPSAPMPASLIGTGRASEAVRQYMSKGRPNGEPILGEPTLQWDLPNDLADPSAPHFDPGVVRLVYFINWRAPTNPEAAGFFEVDAGSGWIVAGAAVS